MRYHEHRPIRSLRSLAAGVIVVQLVQGKEDTKVKSELASKTKSDPSRQSMRSQCTD